MSGNANESPSSRNGGGIDSSAAEDVCDKVDIGSLSLKDVPMLPASPTTRGVSAVQVRGDGLRSGTSATAETTAMMQDLSLTETAAESPDLSDKDTRSTKKLRKCLTFLTNEQIPQAEQAVEQLRRMANRLCGKTMMHRVYYDKAVVAQQHLEWLNEVREMFEEALNCSDEMGESEMRSLEHVESVLLGMWRGGGG